MNKLSRNLCTVHCISSPCKLWCFCKMAGKHFGFAVSLLMVLQHVFSAYSIGDICGTVSYISAGDELP